ncbi:MFS transporter [Alteromonas sp. C1M14]|uniref:MFS transporter n=1 Tax=Alteromonas sp. C1M14 TaxID=2841567 RepID=UPI001C094C48|nr:MFS transporter [Alteromonas sp. C1M14]MBU2979480.1 MFS transporter [Alteromonas sp. C1M14]
MIKLRRRTAITLLVAATLFMEILDATVISTALPIIARDFDVAAAHLSVGISAYLVAVTVFIPISGWAADRFGSKNLFCAAICVFVIASVCCALSTDLYTFTASRVLQGIGGAMMVPVGRLVVLRGLPKDEIVRGMAMLTWPALAAPLIGPVLGGWIAQTFSWNWIFLMNVPLGCIALGFAAYLLDNQEGAPQRFDTIGFLLSGTGFGLLMAGLETFSSRPQSLWLPALLTGVGLLLLLLMFIHMARSSAPLFTLKAMRFPTFRMTILGGSAIRITLSSAPFLIPLMLQLALGFSPVEAGLLLLWLFAGNLTIKPATTWIMNAAGFKTVLVVNTLLIAIGFALIGQFSTTTPSWYMALVLFISGMNRSMHLTVLNTISFADIPQHQMRDANTLSSVVMQMTRGLGITVGALSLALATIVTGSQNGEPAMADFSLTFYIVAGISLLSLVDSLRLPANAGDAILNKRRLKQI